MRRRTFLAALPAAFAFTGAAKAKFAPGDAVQLRVRAGGDDLDAAVYEAVFVPFAAVMPLKREAPFTHMLDVTFSTAGHDWLKSDRGPTGGGDDHWYVGDHPPSQAETHGGGFKWQTSHMHVVLKQADARPLWSADYDYDGGMELSGWTVKTPAQAAALVARRLAARYRVDSQRRTGQ